MTPSAVFSFIVFLHIMYCWMKKKLKKRLDSKLRLGYNTIKREKDLRTRKSTLNSIFFTLAVDYS